MSIGNLKSSFQTVLEGIGQLENDFVRSTADIKKLREETEKKIEEEFKKFQDNGEKKVTSLFTTVQDKIKEFSVQITTIEANLTSKLDKFRIEFLAPLEKRIFTMEEKNRQIEEKFKKIKENL